MPILVACQCGGSFQAPDNLAGKRVKCPACGGDLAVPAPLTEEDAALVDWFSSEITHSKVEEDERRRFEAEKAERERLRRVDEQRRAQSRTKSLGYESRQKAQSPDDITTMDIFLTIFLGVGVILGIIYLIKGKRKGIKLIAIQLAFNLVAIGLGVALAAGMGWM
jgi:hypothetical protein